MDLIRAPKNGDGIDATRTMYPSRLRVVQDRRSITEATSTAYGYVVSGRACVRAPGFEVRVEAGGFFCVPGAFDVEVEGLAVIIERLGFLGLLSAGRIEETGRLAYIDGCSDTLLCSPPRRGDPALNHLHFPAGVEQTLHSHPSIRLGVVARGEGAAFGPPARGAHSWQEPLAEGTVFLLHAHEIHAFRTATGRAPLDVIAYHPDSDWGPTDAAHPMRTRTYLTSGPPEGQGPPR